MLIVTKSYSTGMIEVEHRKAGSMIAVYTGYPTRDGLYKLYPKSVPYGDARFAGKIISPQELQFEAQGYFHDAEARKAPDKASAATDERKPEKLEKTEKPARQISVFDRLYTT